MHGANEGDRYRERVREGKRERDREWEKDRERDQHNLEREASTDHLIGKGLG